MKHTLNKIVEYITDDEKIGAYLYIFIFISRIFLDLIIEKIFDLGEEWQHYIFAFYKYNYVIVIGYMFVYEVFYLYRYKKFHFTKYQWAGILYALVAIIATYAYLKGELAYDYYTKLSLGEMIMTSVFMFDVGSKLKTTSFEKVMEICAKYYVCLITVINVFSLIIYFFNLKNDIYLFGRTITMPSRYITPGALFGAGLYAGLYYNTSIAGLVQSVGIFFLAWLYKAKRIRISGFLILLLINFFCLLLSGSRTSIIGLLVFFILIVKTYIDEHLNNKTGRSTIYFAFLALIIFVLLFFVFKKVSGSDVINNLITDPFETIDNITSKRLRIFCSVISIFKNRPLLGNGWNSVIPVEKYGTLYEYPYAHNIFLGALAWTGGIGFIVFTYNFYHYIKRAFQIIKTNPEYRVCSYIALSIIAQCQLENGIFGDWNHAYTYIFWLIMGFLMQDKFKREKVPFSGQISS